MWTDKELQYRNTFYGIIIYEKELDECEQKCNRCPEKYKCITHNTYYYDSCRERKQNRTRLALKELELRAKYILENADEILQSKNIHWQHKLRVMQLKGYFSDEVK